MGDFATEETYLHTTCKLGLEPLQLILFPEYRSINSIPVVLDNFFSMNTVQTIFSFVQTTSVRPVLSSPKYADVDIAVFQGGQLDLAKEMQTIRCDSHANGFEVVCGEGY